MIRTRAPTAATSLLLPFLSVICLILTEQLRSGPASHAQETRGAECAGCRCRSLELLPVSVRDHREHGPVGARSYSRFG